MQLPQNKNAPVGERIALPQNENGRNLEENGRAMRAPTVKIRSAKWNYQRERKIE